MALRGAPGADRPSEAVLGGGRRHGVPLPVFVPDRGEIEVGRGTARYLQQRLRRRAHRGDRVDDVMRALNELHVGPHELLEHRLVQQQDDSL